jgi:signal transduction histidine kinase/ActR/RegA family two-component response regulator
MQGSAFAFLRYWGLRARSIALLLVTLVPLLGLALYWTLWEIETARLRVDRDAQELADLVSAQVGRRVGWAHELLSVLSQLTAVRDLKSHAPDRLQLFREILSASPHLANLGLVLADGSVLTTGVPLPSGQAISLKDRPWFQAVMASGRPAVGGFQIGRIIRGPDVIVAHPVFGDGPRPAAVVYGALRLTPLPEEFAGIAIPRGAAWRVVDGQGLVLLDSQPGAEIGAPLRPRRNMVYAQASVPRTPWLVTVSIPRAAALRQAWEPLLRVGAPALLILLLAASVGIGIARGTWRPLRALAAAVRRAGATPAPVAFPTDLGGEVGDVARAFQETLERLTKRQEELAALLDATRMLGASLDVDATLQAIVKQAGLISGAPAVRLFLLDEAGDVLRCRVGIGIPHGEIRHHVVPIGQSFSGEVALVRRPLAVETIVGDPRNADPEFSHRHGLVSYLGLPIIAGDRLVGVLVFNTSEPRVYRDEEITLLSAFAQQAAVALENARLFAEVNRSYDSLRQAQEELIRAEKLRALGQMAAGIAHDLNNMLAAVLGQAELLRLQVADPVVQRGLATLETAAADGAQIVRRLQEFARQRTEAPLGVVDLAATVRDALEITRPRWKDEPQRRGRTIEIRADLEELPPILGRAAEVREVLTNLIFNAVDAMPDGGTLTLAAHQVRADVAPSAVRRSDGTPDPEPAPHPTAAPPHSGEFVELAVSDTGVGMTEETRRRAFDPFFTTKGVQGTGLGLSAAYGVMERHRGSIAVASTPGCGSTFTLRFQVAAAEAPPAPGGAIRTLPAKRILLIDDDPMVRETAARLLDSAGHTVLVAESGPAGLRRLAEGPVDIVLTDLGMPEMTGWEVARAVRGHSPRTPVLLLTGWGDQFQDAAERSLVDGVLGKPFRLEDLLRALAKAIAAREGAATE